jgi:hypothetical protein
MSAGTLNYSIIKPNLFLKAILSNFIPVFSAPTADYIHIKYKQKFRL